MVITKSADTGAGAAPLVRLDHVRRAFTEGDQRHRVLHDVCAEIGRGEVVALLGPSGSGKSTLLNIIGGIDLPDAGRVVIDGVDVTALSERERTLFRRERLGFVFQFFNLIPTLTVEENLLLPLALNGRGQQRDRVRMLLERVGLAARAGTYPDRLSGGEQQRIAVVRALVHDPVLVLADEPTGNLDAATGDTVLDLLASLAVDGGRSLIIATHSERVVSRAGRVLMLRGDALVEPAGPT